MQSKKVTAIELNHQTIRFSGHMLSHTITGIKKIYPYLQ